jgi:hypothetical protein
MTVRTVLSGLMHVPDGFLSARLRLLRIGIDKLLLEVPRTQRRNPVEEKREHLLTLNLVTAQN